MSASKSKKAINAARQIVMHSDVSRAMCSKTALTPALDCLRRARVNQGNWRRARRNAIEEAPIAMRVESQYGPGAAYEAGLAIGMPPPNPVIAAIANRFGEALSLGGLPADLEAACREWLRLYDPNPTRREKRT